MTPTRRIFHTKHTAGFTLVEIIVSLGIFAVVAVVALGALVKIVSANRKAQTVQAAVTNINFALDAMSREMRVGRDYYCQSGSTFSESALSQDYSNSTKCPLGYSNLDDGGLGRVIAFRSTKVDRTDPDNPCNLIYAYAFIPKGDGTYTLGKSEQTACNDESYPAFDSVIDPSVTITGYYVRVLAQTQRPFPRAVIRISGYSGSLEKDRTYFDVQTTVSARVP